MGIQVSTDQSGARYVLENGKYRQVTEAEATTLDRGNMDVAAESARNTIQAGGYALRGMLLGGRSGQNSEEAGQSFDVASKLMARQGELSNLRPGAAGFGEEAPFVIAGAVAAKIAKMGSRGANSAVKVAATQGDELARTTQRITPEVSEMVTDLGHTVDTMAGAQGDSVGAAARGGALWAGLRRMPGFKDFLENLDNFVGTKRPLTAGQATMLAPDASGVSLADKVGFEFLPGQRQGNGIIAEAIRRDPAMADAFDSILSANSSRLLERSARSMNLDPGAYGRDIRTLGREAVGQQFNDVELGIGDFKLSDDLVELFDTEVFTGAEKRTAATLADEGGTVLAGQDAMNYRSLLAEELSAARSDPSLLKRARTLDQALDSLDDQIVGAIDDPALMDQWAEARARWRVVRAYDRPGVITPQGDISVKSLVGALEREFVTEFRRAEIPRGANLPDDVVDLLEYVRVAGNFASNLNDSGTATGNSVIGMVTNPGTWAKKRIAARFIADSMLSRPDLADVMPE